MSRRRLFLISKVEDSCGLIVNFTINGDPVQGETCMTGEEGANSEWNTIGAQVYCDGDTSCSLYYEGGTDNGGYLSRYPNGPEEGATLRADEPI